MRWQAVSWSTSACRESSRSRRLPKVRRGSIGDNQRHPLRSMNLRRIVPIMALMLASCLEGPPAPPAPPAGQFGAYATRNKLMYMANGDTLTVYRVKYWHFNDGSSPALQLEFASPVPVSDTAGLARIATQIWPGFLPMVESAQLGTAILTATNLEKVGGPGASVTRTHHLGFIAIRDSLGSWRFKDGGALPPL